MTAARKPAYADIRMMVEKGTLLEGVNGLSVSPYGKKISPPTFPIDPHPVNGRYLIEQRHLMLDGVPHCVRVVILDTPPSQANRAEAGLVSAREEHPALDYPAPELDLRDYGLGIRTPQEVPHRTFDAMFLHSSLVAGGAWNGSAEEWRARLFGVSTGDATFLFEQDPATLPFGTWNSFAGAHRGEVRFQRLYESEIIGVNPMVGVGAGVKSDNIVGYRESAGPIHRSRSDGSLSMDGVPDAEKTRMSEHGFGTIPFSEKIDGKNLAAQRGVSVSHVLRLSQISLAGLRKLRFPADGIEGDALRERNIAARAMILILALLADARAHEDGYSLRSGCTLGQGGEEAVWRLDRPGQPEQERFAVTSDDALALYRQARAAVVAAGFAWMRTPIRLVPDEFHDTLIRRSRGTAAAPVGTGPAAGDAAPAARKAGRRSSKATA